MHWTESHLKPLVCVELKHTLPVGSVVGELVHGLCGPGSQIIVLRAFGMRRSTRRAMPAFCFCPDERTCRGRLSLACISCQSALTFHGVWPHAATRNQRSCRAAVKSAPPMPCFVFFDLSYNLVEQMHDPSIRDQQAGRAKRRGP